MTYGSSRHQRKMQTPHNGKLLLPFVYGSCTHKVYSCHALLVLLQQSRIEDLLNIQGCLDAELPQSVCLKSKYRLEMLERGGEDLQRFLGQARSSYEYVLAAHMGPLMAI